MTRQCFVQCCISHGRKMGSPIVTPICLPWRQTKTRTMAGQVTWQKLRKRTTHVIGRTWRSCWTGCSFGSCLFWCRGQLYLFWRFRYISHTRMDHRMCRRCNRLIYRYPYMPGNLWRQVMVATKWFLPPGVANSTGLSHNLFKTVNDYAKKLVLCNHM